MSVEINEKTEITIPIKTLISIVGCLLVASWYVFTTQNKIADLEHTVKLQDERFISYTKQPGREHLEVQLIKRDLEYLRKEIESFKGKK
jgi:hypothetical protein